MKHISTDRLFPDVIYLLPFSMLQCKEKMRPVKRALKMLESPEENMNESDQVAQTRQV